MKLKLKKRAVMKADKKNKMAIAKAKAINGDSDLEVVTYKPEDDEEQTPKTNRQKRKERRLAIISERTVEEEESKDGQIAEELRPEIAPETTRSKMMKILYGDQTEEITDEQATAKLHKLSAGL
jgi:hypothetical protein